MFSYLKRRLYSPQVQEIQRGRLTRPDRHRDPRRLSARGPPAADSHLEASLQQRHGGESGVLVPSLPAHQDTGAARGGVRRGTQEDPGQRFLGRRASRQPGPRQVKRHLFCGGGLTMSSMHSRVPLSRKVVSVSPAARPARLNSQPSPEAGRPNSHVIRQPNGPDGTSGFRLCR